LFVVWVFTLNDCSIAKWRPAVNTFSKRVGDSTN
jgi:hypothetical protein